MHLSPLSPRFGNRKVTSSINRDQLGWFACSTQLAETVSFNYSTSILQSTRELGRSRRCCRLDHSLGWKLLFVVLLFSLFTQMPAALAQSATHLTVNVTGQSLIAGFNNTVTVTVANVYSGYTAIYDVDISMTVPTSLTMYGDNHWHYDSIAYGQSITLTFQVFAPTSGIGTSYQGSVIGTYKQLGDISYTQETHDIGFSVNGWINLVLYGVQLSPSKVSQGGNATVSGNILDSGNLAAYNTNVTVESDAIDPTASSSVFIGEVDPNIPRPFSLLMVFKQNIAPGNYTITVKVLATDNNRPGVPITAQGNFKIEISKATQTNVNQRTTGPTGIVELILQILRNLYNVFFGSSFP